MQETKNRRLSILLGALCCVTVLVYFLGRDNGTVDVDRDMFRNYDQKAIDQVVLESRTGKVELKFNGSKWKVNNKFDADASMIQVLFATLQQAEPKRPLPSTIQDSVSRELKQNGVKVSLFSAGKPEATFYSGGNAQKTQAYFRLENGEEKPYLVTIPGYRVYVAGIFEVEEKDWMDKLVFGFNWRNFESLEAQFPNEPSADFEVIFRDNYFAVQGLAEVDTSKLNDFLDDVSLLTVEKYSNGGVLVDTTAKSSSAMVITVRDIGKRSYTLKLYKPRSDSGPLIPGLINGTHWAYFSPAKVQNIFKRKGFFEKG